MSEIKRLLRQVYKKSFKESKTKKSVTLTPYEPHYITSEDVFLTNYIVKQTCWEWNGAKDRYGYGKFTVNGKTVKAHRYSYRLHYGEFDQQLHVLHHCDNPCCVNPAHLFLGTNRDNVADREAKARHGDTTKRLTFTQKKQILASLQAGETARALADQYQVHISTIRRLKQSNNDH